MYIYNTHTYKYGYNSKYAQDLFARTKAIFTILCCFGACVVFFAFLEIASFPKKRLRLRA